MVISCPVMIHVAQVGRFRVSVAKSCCEDVVNGSCVKQSRMSVTNVHGLFYRSSMCV